MKLPLGVIRARIRVLADIGGHKITGDMLLCLFDDGLLESEISEES